MGGLPELVLLVGSMLFLVDGPEAVEEADDALFAWGTLVDNGLAKSASSSDLWLGATIAEKPLFNIWFTIKKNEYNSRTKKICNSILKILNHKEEVKRSLHIGIAILQV